MHNCIWLYTWLVEFKKIHYINWSRLNLLLNLLSLRNCLLFTIRTTILFFILLTWNTSKKCICFLILLFVFLLFCNFRCWFRFYWSVSFNWSSDIVCTSIMLINLFICLFFFLNNFNWISWTPNFFYIICWQYWLRWLSIFLFLSFCIQRIGLSKTSWMLCNTNLSMLIWCEV